MFTINLLRLGIAACLTALIAIAAAHAQRTTPCADNACLGLAFSGYPACPQATSFIARTDGTENNTRLTNTICSLADKGLLQKIDGLYVGAMNSAINTHLNWAQNAFTLTLHSGITFTPNQGWTGNGTTGWYDSGYIPSSAGGHLTLNNATLGGCVLTSRGASAGFDDILGATDQTNFFNSSIDSSGNITSLNLSVTAGANFTAANAQGAWIGSRLSSSQVTGYLNGVSLGTISSTSSALPNVSIGVLATNTPTVPANLSTDLIAYVFWGGGFTATDASNFFAIMHADLQAAGAPGGC